jgi:sec-independent protein translocase protein TatB
MPSFQDSAVIFFLALLLFGPKKLPELARYVGKLMGEFRRASSEFRMQMEDEFRLAEQAEQQKKIAAMEAAAPVTPPVEPESAVVAQPELAAEAAPEPAPESMVEPLPIASHGELDMMPPATGLPVARSSASSDLGGVFDSIPHAQDAGHAAPEPEAHPHG